MEQKRTRDFRKRKRAEDLGGGICSFQLTCNLKPSPHPPRYFPTPTNARNKKVAQNEKEGTKISASSS